MDLRWAVTSLRKNSPDDFFFFFFRKMKRCLDGRAERAVAKQNAGDKYMSDNVNITKVDIFSFHVSARSVSLRAGLIITESWTCYLTTKHFLTASAAEAFWKPMEQEKQQQQEKRRRGGKTETDGGPSRSRSCRSVATFSFPVSLLFFFFLWRGAGSVFDQHSGNFIRTEMGG